jgi:Zn-finger nucleic acid-binding protein
MPILAIPSQFDKTLLATFLPLETETDCPKCAPELETKTLGDDIKLERCRTCFGLLAKGFMLEKMRTEFMAETFLDIGSASIGKKSDKVEDIQWPHCKVDMDKIVDPHQTHIWMECCPSCDRIFLDAGEFSDLKYETFSDKIKGFLKGRRH